MKNAFKNSAEVNYSAKEIFKIFKKMIKQDFPRFDEKNPLGTDTNKKIGHHSTKSAEANVEITDYIENEVYEITTVTLKTQITFVSRYTLTVIDENTTLFTLEQSQNAPGFFMNVNHIVQSIFYKGRIKKRFDFLLQGLDNEIAEMRERQAPKKKKVEETIDLNKSSEEDSIKEKENITE
ncbi:DUF3284 domain-containing protein [uncultured Clostridium sp.]|uniref:DUF3284 domain-containing protein n=1 Tax=uncultured Clostridium sp. TaxID=59620 RepID=UPI002611BBE9|nr:DUF3284 domain-containing protein [uncultured Clostridium sp.]